MSDAKRCDRCGAFEHPSVCGEVTHNLRGKGAGTMDLCPSCAQSFWRWKDAGAIEQAKASP